MLSSGAAGNPITFGSYGVGTKPIISGADIIMGFTTSGKLVYQKSGIAKKPNQVFYNGSMLAPNDESTINVKLNEWDWDSNTLYVNVGEDPAAGVVETSLRDAIWGAGGNYITYDNLTLEKANEYGVYLDSVTNVIVQNCEIRLNNSYGVFWGTASAGISIENNYIHHNGFNAYEGAGIFTYADPGSSEHLNYIRNNTIANNYCWGVNVMSNYLVIENNTISNNGSLDDTIHPGGCNGIEIVDLTNSGYWEIRYHQI